MHLFFIFEYNLIMNKIFDLHNDFLTEINSEKKKVKYLRTIENNGFKEIIASVWTSKMNQDTSTGFIEGAHNFLNINNKNNVNIYLSIEDLHFISKNNLDRILNIKPLYCGLTWNYDNILAGGALDGGDFSLLGLDVVDKLESNNIQIDTAHLSERSFMTFSKITERPILCSHTACYNLRQHNRNLKDYQIKMIVESKGLIGLTLVGDFLTEDKKAKVGDIARHIDYIVSRFGDKNISIGTDFYGTKNLPKGIKSYKDLVLIEERLKYMGYSQETIDNIFYNNAKNFYKNVIFSPLI